MSRATVLYLAPLLFAFHAGCQGSDDSGAVETEATAAAFTPVSPTSKPLALVVNYNRGTKESPTIQSLAAVIARLNAEVPSAPLRLVVDVPDHYRAEGFDPAGPSGEPSADFAAGVLPVLRTTFGATFDRSVAVIRSSGPDNYWMQDYAEWVTTRSPSGQPALGSIDLRHPDAETSDVIAKINALPFLSAAPVATYLGAGELGTSDDGGGNVEATPDGKWLLGRPTPYGRIDLAVMAEGIDQASFFAMGAALEAITARFARASAGKAPKDIGPEAFAREEDVPSSIPPALAERFKSALAEGRVSWDRYVQRHAFFARAAGADNVIEVETDWLTIGHVDEVISFVPSDDACGVTLLHADPLLGIRMWAAGETVRMPEVEPKHFAGFFAGELAQTFATRPSAGAIPLDLAKYTNEPSLHPLWLREDSFEGAAIDLAPEVPLHVIRAHVRAARAVQRAVSAIQSKVKCPKPGPATRKIPALGLPVQYGFGMDDTTFAGLHDHEGLPNVVVVRDHVLMREATAPPTRSALQRLGLLLGPGKLHTIPLSSRYRGGALHCATQLLREPRL